jgi:multiple sugar transport system ATP-binding protein
VRGFRTNVTLVATVSFTKVNKSYDDSNFAIRDLDLEIENGEFMVLVGPSGCGKSTALRMIAGLEVITGGDLHIGERRVNDIPPGDRDIAMVFQSYALYPHMTVGENIGFPLAMAKVDKAEIAKRVDEAARILGLREYLDRKPKALSGGQRQRVAMGRAIVRQPSVFLMDEPLSNLDAKLRVQMRGEIIRLQHELATTMVYVTHDQVEAMTMGDRVAVMRKGVLQQVAAPQELYERPDNLFVAGFIGSPAMNFLNAKLDRNGDRYVASFGGFSLALAPECVAAYPKVAEFVGREIVLGVRPEHFEVGSTSSIPDDQRVDVQVVLAEAMGSETHVHFMADVPPVDIEGTAAADAVGDAASDRARVIARIMGTVRARAGESMQLAVDTNQAHVFDPATGLPLR